MKIAFVVGHHENAQGAKSEYFNQNEWAFYNEVLTELNTIIGNINVFYHNKNISGYTSRIKDTANRLNKLDFDLVIELHFNAAVPQANGCETLYYFNSKKGREYAQLFTDIVCDCTGIKSRGVKALTNKKDRGFASVFYPKAPVILIEPFFGTNKKDCELIGSHKNMAYIVRDFLHSINE